MRGAGVAYAYADPDSRPVDGDPIFGYGDPVFGYGDPIFGYGDPIFGYSDPRRGNPHVSHRLTHADGRDAGSLRHVSPFARAYEDTDTRRRQPDPGWPAGAGNRDPRSGGDIDANSDSGRRDGTRRDDAGAGRGDRARGTEARRG
jgi:hypothetical protein